MSAKWLSFDLIDYRGSPKIQSISEKGIKWIEASVPIKYNLRSH